MSDSKPLFDIMYDLMTKEALIYVNNVGFFLYLMNEGIFKQQSDLAIKSMVLLLLLDNFPKKLIGRSLINNAVELLQILCSPPDEDFRFNANKDFFVLQNGVFQVSTKTLLPFDKDYYSTIKLPITYHKEATCPGWLQFIDEVTLSDKKLSMVLQEFVGYCLIPSVIHEKSLFLYGSGSNGKSVFLETIQYLFGDDNVSNIPFHSLGNSFELAQINHKLINISSEINSRGLNSTNTFKQLITGDTVSACYKFKDAFSYRAIAKFIFSANDLPRINDKSAGFIRRLIIVPFNACFTGDTQDKGLKNKLRQEIDGIFLWALEGLIRLESQGGFTQSKQVDEMINQYRQEVNPLLSFIEEECDMEDSLSIEKNTFRDAYALWCRDSGFNRLSDITLSKELVKLGCKTGHSNYKKIFKGIDIKNFEKSRLKHQTEMAKRGQVS